MKTTYAFKMKPDGTIDRVRGVITGLSVITAGPAIGHGVYADSKTLLSVLDAAGKHTGGVRVKMDHGSGPGDIIGALQDFRLGDTKVLADMHLLKTHPRFQSTLEIIERMPSIVGLSISFAGAIEPVAGVDCIRVEELFSVDIVDRPAANPTGMFSQHTAKRDRTPELHELCIKVYGARLVRALGTPPPISSDAWKFLHQELFGSINASQTQIIRDFQDLSDDKLPGRGGSPHPKTLRRAQEVVIDYMNALAGKATSKSSLGAHLAARFTAKALADASSPEAVGAPDYSELLREYEAITDPETKTLFLRENRRELVIANRARENNKRI